MCYERQLDIVYFYLSLRSKGTKNLFDILQSYPMEVELKTFQQCDQKT